MQLFTRLSLAAGCLITALAQAQTNLDIQTGFNRIIPGWTNYSTAFTATHDIGTASDFATVASFYTPPFDVRPVEYGVIVVWLGTGSQRFNFANFDFRVFLWGSVEAFRANPRQGDLATLAFPAPTGGSTTVPDTTTLGGRPAYHLRFSLTNASLTLTQCQSYLVGFAARARVQQDGELYVPTAPTDGPSDVTAGSLVPFGFMYLINAGGRTLYSGQLATELFQQALGGPPALRIRRAGDALELAWPAAAGCYRLEAAEQVGPPANWLPVEETPVVIGSDCTLALPPTGAARWFRLAKHAEDLPPE